MKTALKLAALIVCLQLFTLTTSAQSNKKVFVGIWELSKANSNGAEPLNSPKGYLKIFNTDGTFSNVQARYTGAIISHSGVYKVHDGYYIEKSLSKGDGFTYVNVNRDTKINYQFSDDKKWLTLNFTVEDGTAFTEVWRKL